MRRTPLSWRGWWFAVLACLACAPLGAQTGTTEQPEARRARNVERALEAGRVGEALAEAESAAKRCRENALLQRRLAQARLCSALEADQQLASALEDAAWSRLL